MKKLLVILLAISLVSCEDFWEGNVTYVDPHSSCELKYESIGRNVGRNAMLFYLIESNQIDSVKIEIFDLLAIEDSLSLERKDSYKVKPK
jgi:hypothetical protein